MSEPDVEAVIKAAGRRRKAPVTVTSAPTVETPESTTVKPARHAANTAVDADAAVTALERMGITADAASHAVAAFRRMWGR